MIQITFADSTFWIAYTITNIGAAIMAFTAWKFQRVSRLMFAGLFSWACWFNLMNANDNPKTYLDYAYFAVLPVYQQFILGWFSENITAVVACVAVGQGLIAIGMLLGGLLQRIAAVIALCFFVGILPLGVGSAFPAPLIMGVAAFLLLRTPGDQLWKSSRAVK